MGTGKGQAAPQMALNTFALTLQQTANEQNESCIVCVFHVYRIICNPWRNNNPDGNGDDDAGVRWRWRMANGNPLAGKTFLTLSVSCADLSVFPRLHSLGFARLLLPDGT